MTRHRLEHAAALIVLVGFLLAGRPVAHAGIVLGGGPPETDCFAAFDVPSSSDGSRDVSCTDGNPTCDLDGAQNDICTFNIGVCVHVQHVLAVTSRGPKDSDNLFLFRVAGAPE